MNELIAQLCQDRVFYHFYQISQIPHGSGNEKALSDFTVESLSDWISYLKNMV